MGSYCSPKSLVVEKRDSTEKNSAPETALGHFGESLIILVPTERMNFTRLSCSLRPRRWDRKPLPGGDVLIIRR